MYNFISTVLDEDEGTPPRVAFSATMVLNMKMDKSRRDEEAKICTFLKNWQYRQVLMLN
jgi:hypothetical protein